MTGFDLLIGRRPGDYVEREPAPPLNYRALWPGDPPTLRRHVCAFEACSMSFHLRHARQRFCSRECGFANQRSRRASEEAAAGAGRAHDAVVDILATRWAK